MAERTVTPVLERRQAAFRRLITGIASFLQPEDVTSCLFLHKLPRDRAASPLDTLELLMKRGVFSHSNVEPLAGLLQDINRCDLVTDHVEPFRKDYPSNSNSSSGNGGSISAADGMCMLAIYSYTCELIYSKQMLII